jgi:arylamine N-acetyltransferase
MGNHFTAIHPPPAFINRLMLRALTPEGRVSAVNREVSCWHAGEIQWRRLPDRSAPRALLVARFGFDLHQPLRRNGRRCQRRLSPSRTNGIRRPFSQRIRAKRPIALRGGIR